MLRGVDLYSVTDVSGQPIDAIFKRQPVQYSLTRMSPIVSTETSVTNNRPILCNITEERGSHTEAEAWNHGKYMNTFQYSHFQYLKYDKKD
jgi:hypothetical protein